MRRADCVDGRAEPPERLEVPVADRAAHCVLMDARQCGDLLDRERRGGRRAHRQRALR